jgi:hypothetical protein
MSNATARSTETARCLRCGRKIRSAGAVARGYGRGCWAKVRTAESTVDLSAWSPRQAEDARELIEDGGVIPTAKPGVFRTVSTDGTAAYLTSARFCGCPAGLAGRRCYHGAAVRVVLAASAPSPQSALASAAEADLWTEMERLNDAFMAMA